MFKNRLFVVVLCMILSAVGYAQADTGGNLFFSTSFYRGFFNDQPRHLQPHFSLNELSEIKIGVAWEFPFWYGNAALGLEAGYSSGSRFGGRGGTDFFPLALTAAYAFPLANFFYIGPSVKLGGFGLAGSEHTGIVPMLGARLEAELRSLYFPVGLYIAGGLDAFIPSSPEPSILPAVEVGLRFPRGTLRRHGNQPGLAGTGAVQVPTVPVARETQESALTQTDQVAPVVTAVQPPVATAPVAPAAVTPASPSVVTAPATPAVTTLPPSAAVAPVAPVAVTPAQPSDTTTSVAPLVTPTSPSVATAPVAPTAVTPAQPSDTATSGAPVITPTPPSVATVPAAPAAATPVQPPAVTAPAAPSVTTPPPSAAVAPVTPAQQSDTTTSVAPVVVPTSPSRVPVPGSGREVLEDGRQGVLYSVSVYFEPDTAVLIENFRPVLDDVGRQLAADRTLHVLVRAYAAPFGTSGGRHTVSTNRAIFVRNYFVQHFGIEQARITFEVFGSERAPERVTDDWMTYRCTELTLFRE